MLPCLMFYLSGFSLLPNCSFLNVGRICDYDWKNVRTFDWRCDIGVRLKDVLVKEIMNSTSTAATHNVFCHGTEADQLRDSNINSQLIVM